MSLTAKLQNSSELLKAVLKPIIISLLLKILVFIREKVRWVKEMK